jgi:hypothetical protein
MKFSLSMPLRRIVGVEVLLHSFLTSELDGGECWNSRTPLNPLYRRLGGRLARLGVLFAEGKSSAAPTGLGVPGRPARSVVAMPTARLSKSVVYNVFCAYVNRVLFLDFFILEYGTDRLSRNVGKELRLGAARHPRREQISPNTVSRIRFVVFPSPSR